MSRSVRLPVTHYFPASCLLGMKTTNLQCHPKRQHLAWCSIPFLCALTQKTGEYLCLFRSLHVPQRVRRFSHKDNLAVHSSYSTAIVPILRDRYDPLVRLELLSDCQYGEKEVPFLCPSSYNITENQSAYRFLEISAFKAKARSSCSSRSISSRAACMSRLILRSSIRFRISSRVRYRDCEWVPEMPSNHSPPKSNFRSATITRESAFSRLVFS